MNILKILAERREKLSKYFKFLKYRYTNLFFFFISVGPEVDDDSDSSQEDWSS